MNKLDFNSIEKELKRLKASQAEIELIKNNVQQYNDLVEDYNKGEKINSYLMYQLNIAVTKQINDLKKVNSKLIQVAVDSQPLAERLNKRIEKR